MQSFNFHVLIFYLFLLLKPDLYELFSPKDLKSENKKASMAAARAVLEKCTMMLLTASKVRHSAKLNVYYLHIFNFVWITIRVFLKIFRPYFYVKPNLQVNSRFSAVPTVDTVICRSPTSVHNILCH